MRYARHTKILEIIKNNEVSTQDDLAKLLKAEGFRTTQATISRDIKELGLIKIAGPSGRNIYADAPKIAHSVLDKYNKILKETVLSVKSAQNMIVIKTLTACAGAVCEVIDKVGNIHILGTVAGDNTIFVCVDELENVEEIIDSINKAIQ